MSKWKRAFLAIRDAKSGSYELDLLIWACRNGEGDPVPHYAADHFDNARRDGAPVDVTENMAHALAFLDQAAPDSTITLRRRDGGWTAMIRSGEFDISAASPAPRATAELALIEVGMILDPLVHEARMQSWDKKTETLPEPAADQMGELIVLSRYLDGSGREALIEFEGCDGGSVLTSSLSGKGPEIPEALAERLLRLAPYLIACEMPDWDQDAGSAGRIRIGGGNSPWIDALDRNEDWLLDRCIDTEPLEGMSFENDPGDEGPSP